MAVLLLALPALAGNVDPCAPDPSDTDGDGICAAIDNCSSASNPAQIDGDQDGFGDVCDCDFSPSANLACDGGDFTQFVLKFGTAVPPTNCEFDIAPNGAVDGGDFTAFVLKFGGLPGPACGNAAGVACPNGGGPAVPGVPCP
jgi:hypothetical protein